MAEKKVVPFLETQTRRVLAGMAALKQAATPTTDPGRIMAISAMPATPASTCAVAVVRLVVISVLHHGPRVCRMPPTFSGCKSPSALQRTGPAVWESPEGAVSGMVLGG